MPASVHIGGAVFIVCLAAFFDLWFPAPNEAVAIATGQMKSHADHQRYFFMISQPKSAKRPAEGWPVIVFLHGVMECGAPQFSKLTGQGPLSPLHRLADMPYASEAAVVAPQAPCSAGGWFEARTLKLLIDEVVGAYRLDSRRVYLTGVSSGAYAVWSLLSNFPRNTCAVAARRLPALPGGRSLFTMATAGPQPPQPPPPPPPWPAPRTLLGRFAAALPIAGGGDPNDLPANKGKPFIPKDFQRAALRRAAPTPVLVAHCEHDSRVPTSGADTLA